MKKNYVKVTATTALLSAAIFGGPLIGSAHWEEKGQANDWKQSHQKMEKQHWNKNFQKMINSGMKSTLVKIKTKAKIRLTHMKLQMDLGKIQYFHF
ncbi:hypothetical protein OR571_22545 [Psychrobacillus sp. NEAU-3TGS]|uniref:hypothetical protein n=1 Tax=Psychrobacillus sp. NEAU-3TGS TaxID=2995412 RepID=UPI00249676F4|nr:hypothetical protein [Psychrobacillus sp. NEAU-3TGS]MDI2589808.1 hypothetical protein [Psychrobacillus sp. NEAU-3TGS]